MGAKKKAQQQDLSHPWNLPVMSSRKRSGGGSGHKSQQTMTAAFNSSSYTKIKEADLPTFVEKELSRQHCARLLGATFSSGNRQRPLCTLALG